MEELKRIREAAGFTQVGLAEASGVDRGTIIKIERGRRSPTVETLEKLAVALKVEVADFFPKGQAPLPLDFEAAAGRVSAANSTDVWEEVHLRLGDRLIALWSHELEKRARSLEAAPSNSGAAKCFREWAESTRTASQVYLMSLFEAYSRTTDSRLEAVTATQEYREGVRELWDRVGEYAPLLPPKEQYELERVVGQAREVIGKGRVAVEKQA